MITRFHALAALNIIIALPCIMQGAEEKKDSVEVVYDRVFEAFLEQNLQEIRNILTTYSDPAFKKQLFLHTKEREGTLLHMIARNSIASGFNRNGHTVIIRPKFKIAVAQELVKHGATVALNTTDGKERETPLLAALSLDDGIEQVDPFFPKYLVEAKADVSLRNRQQEKPLAIAIACSNYHRKAIKKYPSVEKQQHHATRDEHKRQEAGFNELISALYSAPTNDDCCAIL